MVEMRRFQEAQAQRPPVEASVPGREESLATQGQQEEEEYTLRRLLEERPREKWDVIIAHHSQHYANQVGKLDDVERDDLRQRLREWWPSRPFSETITFAQKSGTQTSWTIDNFAAAWLWYGPELEMELSPEQWAQIASSGVLFEKQTQWLKAQATDEGISVLAAQTTSPEGRAWREALRVVPGSVPDELAAALVAHLRSVDQEYELREIAHRLAEDRHVDALRAIAQVADEFADVVAPYLAQEGDRDALGRLLDELRDNLAAGERIDGDDLGWLVGVGEETQYLPRLFECLVLAHRARDEMPRPGPRRGRRRSLVTVGWGVFSDPVSPLVHAIKQIGGPAAVAGYDEILRTQDDVEFLRLQRQAIAQAELGEAGVNAGLAATEELGLPWSPSESAPGSAD
jgi:hypothetical protein